MYNPQIETFLRVADAGSFHKAAEQQHVTAAAVAKQINLLEAELDLELFVRTHRGLLLTAAGKSLYKDVEYIIRYSKESVVRARNAEKQEEQIIRIGISPMTPIDFLTDLWPEVHRRCPELKYECISFSNSVETAREGLKIMGQNIDIIAGLYDEDYIQKAGCKVLPLFKQPVRLGVSVRHRLAGKEQVTLEDLHGEKLMMIYQGWNCELDKLRLELQSGHPQVQIEDFYFFDVDVFNKCENGNDVMVACDLWHKAHPLMKLLPMDRDYQMEYGLFHAEQPSEPTRQFLKIIEEITGSGKWGQKI